METLTKQKNSTAALLDRMYKNVKMGSVLKIQGKLMEDRFENEMVFTKRAKRVLETAWQYAKKQHKTKIESADLLWAITTEPDSLAMQALEQLGTDVVEIREGIKKHTLKQQ